MAAQKARLFCFKVKQSHIVQLFCTVMWKFSVENHLSKWGLGPRRGNRLFTVSNSVSSVVWLSTFSSRDNAQFIARLAQSPKSLPRQTLLLRKTTSAHRQCWTPDRAGESSSRVIMWIAVWHYGILLHRVQLSWGGQPGRGKKDFSNLSTVSTAFSFILPIYPFPWFSALLLAFMSLNKEPKPQNRAIEPNLQRLKVAQLSEEIALGSGPWSSIWKENESGVAFSMPLWSHLERKLRCHHFMEC